MARKRVTYRPSKAGSALGGVVGGLFVLIGLFVAIPTFGLFGVLWTLIAVGITGANLYQAFGKGYVGPEIHIEEESDSEHAQPAAGPPGDTQGPAHRAQGPSTTSASSPRRNTSKRRREILKEL